MQRRNFLRHLGLAGIFGAVPSAITRASANRPAGEAGIKGRVHAGGKALEAVAVTDGKNVVRTDKKGFYELPANAAAEFVYISLPSGYDIPHNNGIAQIYKSVGGSKEAGFDFELEQLSVDDRRHCFVVWADTQMISESDAVRLKSESVPDLKALVQSYAPGTLFHGIGCGDLVWDRFDLFADYKEAISMTGVPFFNVIGNHDMDLDARTDDYSARTFKQQFGPTYYSFNRGKIHYVVLDDVFFIGTAKKYIGYITENQLSWLEKDLAFVQHGTTIVVSLHIPTNTGAARRNQKEEEFGGTVSNRKQLYKLLAPYKVHIMSGHTHFNEKWEDGNIMEHNHGTVCGAWWTGPVCGDGTPMGYGVYEVDGDNIKWHYKATGKPGNHQFKMYDKTMAGIAPEEFLVNVWNWDEKWKVEWLEDGVMKGTMQQRVGIDPVAASLYSGPDLPARHKFVEPTLADHLFFAKPSPSAKKITVKVTDRFGNIFMEHMQWGGV